MNYRLVLVFIGCTELLVFVVYLKFGLCYIIGKFRGLLKGASCHSALLCFRLLEAVGAFKLARVKLHLARHGKTGLRRLDTEQYSHIHYLILTDNTACRHFLMPYQQESDKHGRKNETYTRHYLGNTQASDIKRVCAQAFDKHSAESVPAGIFEDYLPMEFALLIEYIDKREAYHIPERFIEEGGVNISRLRHAELAYTHAPWQGRIAAVCLRIHEVAPSADSLRYHDARDNHIAHHAEGLLLVLCHKENHQCADNHAAVDCKTAVTRAYHIPE